MIYREAKAFKKGLRKLSKEKKKSVAHTLRIFSKNPYDPRLRNHKLQGKQKGKRSIYAGYDLRIIYREEGGHVIVFLLQVGSHEEVY